MADRFAGYRRMSRDQRVDAKLQRLADELQLDFFDEIEKSRIATETEAPGSPVRHDDALVDPPVPPPDGPVGAIIIDNEDLP